MAIPSKATVLVVGGGPAGSYAACCLARENVDVVLLDADKFPRYHVGESMLPTMRHYLDFVDLEKDFDAHGFMKKFGATFKITDKNPAYTNFAASLGEGGYSWNVVRSESDNLIFKHAAKSGAKTFDEVKVLSFNFEPFEDSEKQFIEESHLANPGRPVSAAYEAKDGSKGTISFDYLVDASGRNGLMCTKYLKSRTFNQGLKNIANWTYWRGAKIYNPGQHNENSPFFEALTDGSGWCWAIPLHKDGEDILSVGMVARQDFFFDRKKESGLSGIDFYLHYMEMAPEIREMVRDAECISEMRQASDWSYSSSAYAGPNFRIAGDAGCFVDPYFSSGVHLALNSGLSAAATIQASRNNQTTEAIAAKWHGHRVSEGYTRFLLLVMSVLRQLRMKNQNIIATEADKGFDAAFLKIQTVIQGTADVDADKKEVDEKSKGAVNFALESFNPTAEQQQEIMDKVVKAQEEPEIMEKLTPNEVRILSRIVNRTYRSAKDSKDLSGLAGSVTEGMTAHLVRGELGLKVAPPTVEE